MSNLGNDMQEYIFKLLDFRAWPLLLSTVHLFNKPNQRRVGDLPYVFRLIARIDLCQLIYRMYQSGAEEVKMLLGALQRAIALGVITRVELKFGRPRIRPNATIWIQVPSPTYITPHSLHPGSTSMLACKVEAQRRGPARLLVVHMLAHDSTS